MPLIVIIIKGEDCESFPQNKKLMPLIVKA